MAVSNQAFRITKDRADNMERQLRNIVFNVEQNPDAHTVRELLASIRSIIGLKPGERP